MFTYRPRFLMVSLTIVLVLAGLILTPAQPAAATASYSFSGILNGSIDIYVDLPAGENFAVALDCPGAQIDPIVFIIDPSGALIGADDDGGPNACQYGFRSSLANITTTTAGTYRINANCYTGCTGAYLLTINGGNGFAGRGIPDGFVLRTITCSVAVFDAPNGKPVGDNRIVGGQTWYVDPKGSKTVGAEGWTEVFVSGSTNGWIPSKCVSSN